MRNTREYLQMQGFARQTEVVECKDRAQAYNRFNAQLDTPFKPGTPTRA